MEGYPPAGYPGQQPYYGGQQQQLPYNQQQGYYPPQEQQQQQQYPPPQQQQYTPTAREDQQAPLLDNQQSPPVANTDEGSLQPEESVDVEEIVGGQSHHEKVQKREVVDHDKYDIDLLQDVAGMQNTKANWKFQSETLIATWVLFNAITTIMLVLTNMQKKVPRDIIDEFGESKFNAVMTAITYIPLGFFALLFLLFNNYFAEKTFYMYLQRGAIVDYPESSSIRYLLRSWRPLLFVFIALGYVGCTLYAMFVFKADAGTVLIWLNNMVIGICMFWYRQQSIEYRFVSISNFIQAFPNRKNVYGDMDETSLFHASKLMQKFVLTESAHPSYTGYMRNFWWKKENYTGLHKIMHHIGLFGLMFALAGLAFAYFFVIGRLDLKSKWAAEISPCTASCFKYYTDNAVTDTTKCHNCICDCMRNLQYMDGSTVDACSDYLTVGHCKGKCPDKKTCGFK